jgi:hypothetical protein
VRRAARRGSGYATTEDVARALAAGFDLHLAKPADIGEVEAGLEPADDLTPRTKA